MGGTLSAMGHTQGGMGMMGNMAQKEPVTPKVGIIIMIFI